MEMPMGVARKDRVTEGASRREPGGCGGVGRPRRPRRPRRPLRSSWLLLQGGCALIPAPRGRTSERLYFAGRLAVSLPRFRIPELFPVTEVEELRMRAKADPRGCQTLMSMESAASPSLLAENRVDWEELMTQDPLR
ncbi:uncharacterized protein LOC128928445 isoform X3 [Callithrix jacchus]